ncbi:MAG: thioredoxin family protein [Saprospiraceae bacterium]
MKKGIILLVLVLTSLSTIFAQDWQTDFATAKEMASKESKTIVLVFQGSDWCVPCIKLDREIWNSDTFTDYANDNFVMLQADFPKKRKNTLSEAQAKANAELAEKYNKSGGFPFVVVLDSEGNVLGETGYKKTTPEAYIETLNSFIQ